VLFLCLLHVLSYNSGGVRNSGNAFILSIILNAFILLGKRFGLWVTFICFANLVYFYCIATYTSWIDFSYFKNNIKTVNLDYLITLTICVLSIWFQARYLFLIHNKIIDRVNNSNKIILDNELKTQQLQQLIVENELKTLRAQMNPHFTYNIMNSIQYFLMNNEPEKAIEYLLKFSKLNRFILNNSAANFIPLNNELEALHIYLELEQIRFSNNLTYAFTIDPTIQQNNCYIPSMILQPFIENSLKHGFKKDTTNGYINIGIKQVNDTTIIVTIVDNGMGIEASKKLKEHNLKGIIHKSYGIDITKDRIRLLNMQHQNKASFEIINGSGNGMSGTTIKLTLPILNQLL
jgi:sensor histidine kinase YesM